MTCLQVVFKLTPALLQRTLVVVAYDGVAEAGRHVTEIIDRFRPIGLEALDEDLINDQQQLAMNVEDLEELPPGRAWLLVQFGSDEEAESVASAQALMEWLEARGHPADGVLISKSAQEGGNSEDLWTIREAGLAATAFPPDGQDHWPGWEDSAVPPSRVGDYVADLQELYAKYGLHGAFYGHLGQGCIHSRISFDLRTAKGVADYRAFLEEAAELVTSYGGTLSGEHGDGQQRAELLEKQYGPELVAAMREFKRVWDPRWRMNPGKVIDPFKLDEDLKLGTGYNPPRPPVKFTYKQDGGDFAHATLRCVGVGKCRVPHGEQTMCPSYQVTREEQHSTRGRARLLFEMLRGEVITGGWQSREVFDALDLCLSCKGCTNDCPVNVDMPTYKAEFLYHHYRSLRRWRPRYAYAMGFIDQASRLASRFPELANAATRFPPTAAVARLVAGVDRHRRIPAFAAETLQDWFRRRGGTANPRGRPVVLFPDTFNNRLHADVGVACVEALEAAGWQVIVPEGHVCCGRPLYDYGFLDAAETYLRRVLDVLRPYARAGIPVVGLEPSCLAVFRDELTKMLPHDDDARRLAQNALHFGELLTRFDVDLPHLDGKALVWTHCHGRATGQSGHDEQVLERMGLEVESVQGGCCGLAGSWGFERGKWDLSVDCGEQALLPAVRRAEPGTVVVADGFSCRTQISQTTERRALHLGEVLRLASGAAHAGPGTPAAPRPEDRLGDRRPVPPASRRVLRTALPVAAIAGTVAAAGGLARRRPPRGRARH